MRRLDPAGPTGAFSIDNQPQQRGAVKVTYSTTMISIRDQWGGIWQNIPFTNITNGSTGNAFTSMAELKTFVDANFYEA